MNLDLRVPMGSLFALIGMILTVFGAVTNGRQAVYAGSLGIDVNLWWGPVLLVFGLMMLILARRTQKRLENVPVAPAKGRKTRQ